MAISASIGAPGLFVYCGAMTKILKQWADKKRLHKILQIRDSLIDESRKDKWQLIKASA